MPFFSDGPASDPAYVSTRDHQLGADSKVFIESLWKRYCQYADSAFRDDARNHFHQRFWEMYLAVTLLDKGFELDKHGDDGPEFSAQIDGMRVWFEAIAPTPGTGADRVPELASGEVRKAPVKEILLRFTNALDEKRQRYLAAVDSGRIASEDGYVLAINSRGISIGTCGISTPYFVQAFLAIGPLAAALDPKSLEIIDSYHQYRPQIEKANGAPVSTCPFLGQDAAYCSTVIHSAVDCANYPTDLGADFVLLHNPNASRPITEATFPWWSQFQLGNNIGD